MINFDWIEPYLLPGSILLSARMLSHRLHQRVSGNLDGPQDDNVIFNDPLTPRSDFQSPGILLPDHYRAVVPEVEPDSPKQRFLVDSLFLLQAFQTVCRLKSPQSLQTAFDRTEFREVFCFGTGPMLDDLTFVLAQLVGVRFAEQRADHVTVDDTSNIAAMNYLDDVGLPFLCHIHSHPSFGRAGTTPSSTDRTYQRRLESVGHVCLGLIFTRDGFFRVYAHDEDRFDFRISGKLTEQIDDHTYRLTLGQHNVPDTVRVHRRQWPVNR